MRNLILVHFKRFWFRWETIAVTLWNLLLGLLSAYLASQLYFDRVFNSSHNDFVYFYLLFAVLSLCGTMSAVLLMETANLNSGALRNYLLGGYTKTQIVVSKFFVNTVFGMMQGLLLVLNIGTEFSAGAFRNKLIAGYTKQALYLSETALTLLLSSVMFCLTALPFVVFRFGYLSKMNYFPLAFGSIFAAYIFMGILTVLFCFVTMNRTVAAIISLLLTFGLYWGSYSIEHILKIPEYYTTYYRADGSSYRVSFGNYDTEDMDDIDVPIKS